MELVVDDAEAVSTLIGDIYDASLDATLWPHAFDGIRGFLGDCTATLISQGAVTKAVDVHFMLGHEQEYIDLYFDRYFKINPIFPTVMFFDIEQTPDTDRCAAASGILPDPVCQGVDHSAGHLRQRVLHGGEIGRRVHRLYDDAQDARWLCR